MQCKHCMHHKGDDTALCCWISYRLQLECLMLLNLTVRCFCTFVSSRHACVLFTRLFLSSDDCRTALCPELCSMCVSLRCEQCCRYLRAHVTFGSQTVFEPLCKIDKMQWLTSLLSSCSMAAAASSGVSNSTIPQPCNDQFHLTNHV